MQKNQTIDRKTEGAEIGEKSRYIEIGQLHNRVCKAGEIINKPRPRWKFYSLVNNEIE